jgi:hypothetical protein
MKTTLELPDALMRRVRLLAVQRSQKLKDAVAQLLELGMAVTQGEAEVPKRLPKPVRLKGIPVPTIHDIGAAIDSGRE